jgi:hypothetical protein
MEIWIDVLGLIGGEVLDAAGDYMLRGRFEM